MKKRTKVHELEPPGTLIQPSYLSPMAFLIASLIAQLHHFTKNDAINVDNEYIRRYDLTISL